MIDLRKVNSIKQNINKSVFHLLAPVYLHAPLFLHIQYIQSFKYYYPKLQKYQIFLFLFSNST